MEMGSKAELMISATDSCSWLVMVEAGSKAELVISATDSCSWLVMVEAGLKAESKVMMSASLCLGVHLLTKC